MNYIDSFDALSGIAARFVQAGGLCGADTRGLAGWDSMHLRDDHCPLSEAGHDHMERDDWIAVCAHQLQRQWRTVDPDQLQEVAADLWRDERLRAMAPQRAAVEWLRPLAPLDQQPKA